MTDQDINTETPENKSTAPAKVEPPVVTAPGVDEAAYLASLKEEATLLGVPYSGNIGAASLADRIDLHKKNLKEKKEAAVAKIDAEAVSNNFVNASTQQMDNEDLELAVRRRHAKQLHRVIVTCHDPAKSKINGKIFTVGNSAYGTETKYVPFSQPWHVSTMMLNAIKEKQYTTHYTVKDQKTGTELNKTRLVPEYSIQTLPALTDEELRILAEQQKLRDSGEAAR